MKRLLKYGLAAYLLTQVLPGILAGLTYAIWFHPY